MFGIPRTKVKLSTDSLSITILAGSNNDKNIPLSSIENFSFSQTKDPIPFKFLVLNVKGEKQPYIFYDDVANLELWYDSILVINGKSYQSETIKMKRKFFESMIEYALIPKIEQKEIPPPPPDYNYPTQ
jgi:hypothetical protein